MTVTMTAADEKIRLCLDKQQSFILDAGAGSGKTTSLVEALRYLVNSSVGKALPRTSQKVACITFTNVAANEIVERTGNNPLIQVSTIHDFLWRILKPHQKALKEALLQHNQSLEAESSRKRDEAQLVAALHNLQVIYSDRGPEFLEGRIFHDDLIDVASKMFEFNPLLSKIVAARNPFIFVDEYQDTSRTIVAILLDRILKENRGTVVVGFFGDKLQNIYHGGAHPGVGEIPAALGQDLVRITKEENYRCSEAVITVLNKIRDDIKQLPAGKNEKGAAVYLRLTDGGDDPLLRARKFVREHLGWDLAAGTEKELFLTHKLISRKAGYEKLLEVYQKRGGFFRDRLLNGEDKLVSYLQERIEPLMASWQEGRVGKVVSVLRNGGFKLGDNDGKALAKKALDELLRLQSKASVREVLVHIRDAKLGILLDEFTKWMDVNPETAQVPVSVSAEEAAEKAAEVVFYAELMRTPYSEVSAFCRFLEENTPFSTKHGVKGTEFDTVFVLLDDKGARWNQYAFDKYLSGEDESKGKEERAQRTRNLFYVCCSRAKRNLIVVDLGIKNSAKDARLSELFGSQNCFTQ